MTSTGAAISPREAAARTRKVVALVDVIRHLMSDVHPDAVSRALRDASPELRAELADLAGVRVPSDTTWRMVCDVYRTLAPAHSDTADPFAGV